MEDIISGFKVLDKSSIPEMNAEGVWLKHDKTGMEVYHIHCDDEENLFGFTFKTPPSDSTGVAHVIEHSVLCGSKNFPLKDPFLQLSNQSVKTFLNAMTFPDKTVYPASSMIEADYFNLMRVYGDAVFFPLLEEWTFAQEAHHLEYDENGKLCIKGVVYNEMKGNYSSFDGIAADWSTRSLLPETAYDVDSGGDPDFIPDLTHEQFKKFHETYYSPANCRLFLYGNIPLEKQLAFIESNFLTPFVESCPNIEEIKARVAGISVGKLNPFSAPKTMTVTAPAGNDGKETVLINWMTGSGSDAVESMESAFLSEVLLGHDASPLSRALVESRLGEDISPCTGLETELKYTCFTVGLRGMKSGTAGELEKLVFATLEDLYKNGIPKEEIEAAVLSMDFSNREIRRSHGPFSLVLMRRCLKGWLHGERPDSTLVSSRSFDIVKKRLASDSDYLKKLLKKLLIDNVHRTTVIVKPDTMYETKAQERVDKRIEKLFENMSDSEKKRFEKDIIAKKEKLSQIQQEQDSKENLDRIPHLKPSELPLETDMIKTESLFCGNNPVFYHKEPTNGIVYLEMGFPTDTLEPADYLYLPFLSSAITSIGFAGEDWKAASARTARTVGGLGASLFTSSASPALPKEVYEERKKNDSVFERDWMFFRVKLLEEKLPLALDLLFDCIYTADFFDKDRIRDLLLEYRNDFVASVAPAGNQYAASRTSRLFSRSKAVDEIWNGLTQLYATLDFVEMDQDEFSKKLTGIRDKLVEGGAVVNITADEKYVEKAINLLQPRLEKMPAIKPPFESRAEDFYLLTETADYTPEVYTGPLQVGFASVAFPASPFGTKESVAEAVFGHWLTNSLLWEQIRTIGGAYGAYAFPDALEGVFIEASYRDPDPVKTLSAFSECMKKAASFVFDNDTVDKAVTGTYSKEVQPRSPVNRGFTGFVRKLYGIEDEVRKQKMQLLKNITAKDIEKTAKKLLKCYEQNTSAIIAPKLKDFAGKIIELPL